MMFWGVPIPPITPMIKLKRRPKRLHSVAWYAKRRGKFGRSVRRSY